jgi:hypothetical protein
MRCVIIEILLNFKIRKHETINENSTDSLFNGNSNFFLYNDECTGKTIVGKDA